MSSVEHKVDTLDSVTVVSGTEATPQKKSISQGRIGRRYTSQVLLTSAPLFATDFLAIVGSTLCVLQFVDFISPGLSPNPLRLIVFISIALPLIYSMFRLYPGSGLNPIVEFRQTIMATTSLFAAFVAASLVHDGRQGYLSLLAAACLLSVVLVPLMRSITRRVFAQFQWWGQPLLIFGGNKAGVTSYNYYSKHSYLGLRPIGIVEDMKEGNWSDEPLDPSAYLGPLEKAPAMADRHGTFWGVVAMPGRSAADIRDVIESYARNIPHLLIVADMGELPSLWNCACDCAGSLGIQMEARLLLPVPRIIKRVMDLSIVFVGGVVCSPMIALIAILIKASSRGPIIYRQERVGHGGHRFWIWKFRTMIQDAEDVLEQHLAGNPQARDEWEKDSKLKSDPRVTCVGRWLRRTSLDELPQIWNVILGEMSLVGPRPIMNWEYAKYSQNRAGFHLYAKVLPGITGLWQISGRNDTTYEKRMDLDSYYVRNWSPWMDMYILVRTVRVVVRREGAY